MDKPTPIVEDTYLHRIQNTQALMAKAGLDGLIVVSNHWEREGHLAYLLNHHVTTPSAMSHHGLGYAAAVLPANGKATLVVPLGLGLEKVVGIEKTYESPDLVAELVTAIKHQGLQDKKIGVVGMDILPVAYYLSLAEALPKSTLCSADELVESQRLIKGPDEVRLLREAAHVADLALLAGLEAIQPGVSPVEIENIIRARAIRAGAGCLSDIRIASGKPIQAHGEQTKTDQPIQDGDFVYLQVAGWRQGYGFESSRVKFAGQPNQNEVEYLNHLVEATDWMIEVMKPGREFRFILTESRARVIRPIGHGIGLELRENPWLLLGRDFTLEPGMAICIEPTVSTKEHGTLGIEETLLVTDTGVEVLTCCPRVTW